MEMEKGVVIFPQELCSWLSLHTGKLNSEKHTLISGKAACIGTESIGHIDRGAVGISLGHNENEKDICLIS